MRKSILVSILVLGLGLLSACGGGAAGGGHQLIVTHFSVTAPANATAGTAVSFTVTALDASNNVVSTYSGTVHFTCTDSQAMLPPNSILTNGTGTFSVTLMTVGSQTITAVDTSAGSVTGASNSISVTNQPATHFSVVAPGAATIGTAFSVIVSAMDASNDIVTTNTGTVHFSSTDSQAVLPMNSTLMNGTASFSVSLKTTGSQQITATDTVTASITGTSNSVVVTAAKAENPLPFVNQPLSPDAAAPSGAAFNLTVNGTGFVPASVVNWNGKARVTTFVSKSQLKAAIQTSDLASPVTVAVTVTNPEPGGGVSNVGFFAVTLSRHQSRWVFPILLRVPCLPRLRLAILTATASWIGRDQPRGRQPQRKR